MKRKNAISALLTSLLVLSLISTTFGLYIPSAHAVTAVKQAALTSCAGPSSTTSGQFYDSANGFVWQTCYDSGKLYKVDYSTSPATTTEYATQATFGTFNVIAQWGDGTYLYPIGRSSGQVFKLAYSSPASVSVLAASVGSELLYPAVLSGFIYVPHSTGVAKVSTSTGAITQLTTSTQMFACSASDPLVFCTSTGGSIYEIDPSVNSITLRISGLGLTRGLCVTATAVFTGLASTGSANVLKISRSSWTTVASATLAGAATAYGVACYLTYVGVSTQGGTGPTYSDRDFVIYNQSDLSLFATINTPVVEDGQGRPLFMVQSDAAGNFYVGFQGSAGTVQISDWQSSAPSTTTTTTTTSTTSTATTDASGCVIGTQCAGSWTAIVTPTLQFSENMIITRNGSATINGVEWFLSGPSEGEFLQWVQLLGCCALIIPALNPSNGTFAALQATMRLQAPAWYLPDLPTVDLTSQLIPTSPTKFGWLCYDRTIADNYLGCFWAGGGNPIKYRTFTLAVDNLQHGRTILQFAAEGTASRGQASHANIFIDYPVGS